MAKGMQPLKIKTKILFKIPTRQRPTKFLKWLDVFYNRISDKHDYILLVSLDDDDLTMTNSSMLNYRLRKNPNLQIDIKPNKNKIEAINSSVSYYNFEYLVILSDDMFIKEKYFDDVIVKKFEEIENGDKEKKILLSFNDGDPDRKRELCTIAMLNKPLYDYFGFVYDPRFKSLFCDTWQSYLCNKNGWLYTDDRVIIEHELRYNLQKPDELLLKNYKYWVEDEAMYNTLIKEI